MTWLRSLYWYLYGYRGCECGGEYCIRGRMRGERGVVDSVGVDAAVVDVVVVDPPKSKSD